MNTTTWNIVARNTTAWNTTATTTGQYECHPGMHYGMMFFAIVPVFEIIINVVVIVAVVRSRQKLRHNFVYIYVINTLTANLLFGIFSFYELLNLVLVFERNWNSPEPFQANNGSLLGWWAFRAGMLVSLFIAMSGSISALIYGIRESSYFIGRTARSNVREKTKLHNRRTMWTVIFFNWLIPVILCIACASGWSCVKHCTCTPAFYGDGVYPCRSDIYTQCSRIMNPLRKDFILLSAIFWLLETVGIGFMITTTIRKYKKIVSSPKFKSPTTVSACIDMAKHEHFSNDDATVDNETSNCPPSHDVNANRSCNDVTDNQCNSKPRHSEISLEDTKSRCISLPPLNHNIKLLLVMSVLFVLFTSPAMIIVVIDSVSKEYALNYLGVVLPYAICLFYGFISPLVLVYYMSGLRTALVGMLFGCSLLTKTITVSNNSSSGSG